MTYEKVRDVCEVYAIVLGAHIAKRGAKCKLCHVMWMLNEMYTWEAERLEKLFRWLGFVQGVLWCEGVFTIDEMKEHNRSKDGE